MAEVLFTAKKNLNKKVVLDLVSLTDPKSNAKKYEN